MPASSLKTLEREIAQGKFAPIYFLSGEEPYFIDRLTHLLEEKVLEGAERSFNYEVLYGSSVNVNDILARARTYPTLARYRLVVVKEAQSLRELNRMSTYLEQPVPSSVVVFQYRRKLDTRTKIGRQVKDRTAFYESKALYENEVGAWVEENLRERGYGIDEEALQILVASLGTNLQQIDSELTKLLLHLADQPGARIQKDLVYDLVNIDRQFNVFELIRLIAEKKQLEAYQVLHYMLRNSRDVSPIFIVSQLFSFFSRLAVVKQRNCLTEKAIADLLRIKPFIAGQYQRAMKRYSLARIQANLVHLLEADLMLKGVDVGRVHPEHILKTTLFRILQ